MAMITQKALAERTVTYGGNEPTVAEDNPKYPADKITVVVAFVKSGLNSRWPAWTEAAPQNFTTGLRRTTCRSTPFSSRGLLFSMTRSV